MTNVLFLVFFTMFSQASWALESSACDRHYSVAVNNYAPLFSRDHMNRPRGLVHDLIDNLRQKTGCAFIEKDLSRVASIDQLNRDRVDILMLVFKGAEFEAKGRFVPLYKVKREMIVLNSNYNKNSTLEDYLQNKKIKFGNITGARTALSPDESDLLVKKHRLIEAPDLPAVYRLLAKGRVQGLVYTPMVNTYYSKVFELEDKTKRILDNDSVAEIGMYLSKRRVSAADAKSLELALQAMKDDGSLLKILTEYMPRESVVQITLK